VDSRRGRRWSWRRRRILSFEQIKNDFEPH